MISTENVRQIFQGLLDAPLYIKPELASIESQMSMQVHRGIPVELWKDAHPLGCYRHITVFYKSNVIPRYCFDCYKVEILPRTVVELFKLLMVFEKLILPHDNSRKCMVEKRPHSSGTYKGFVYCLGSPNEAKELRNIIRDAVLADISPEVPVTLKRGCSEYALAYPKFAQVKPGVPMMEYRKYWRPKEDAADKAIASQAGIDNTHNIGVLHNSVENILLPKPRPDQHAIDIMRKSAEQGDAKAQYNLGFRHEEGKVIPQDYKAAVEWYRKAAEQGNAEAQYRLGWMCYQGRGTPQNYVQAMEWLRKEAEHGYLLSDIYSMKYWLRYAATIGDMSYLAISSEPVATIPGLSRPAFSTTIANSK